MQIKSDTELLNEYARHRSEAAFGEIVRRYADFVYSAALRQAGNPEQARDVAQVVFITLARKAGSLSANTVLIGWLCHTARLAALDQLRKDSRRLQRERHAMDLVDSTEEAAEDWNTVRPVLDEAIASLGGEDRDALLLRFFKNESLAAVGAALGVSEDAAQKRVARALGKLREFLTGRGVKTTTAMLSATLATNAVQAAPAGIAGFLTAGALTKAAAASPAAGFFKLFTFANLKTSVAVVALTGGLVVLVALQIHSRNQLRDARALAAEQSETINALRAAGQAPANSPAELEQLRADARDVLRLRSEVTRLRRDLANLPTVSPRPPVEVTPRQTALAQINVKAKFISVPSNYSPAHGSHLTGSQAEALMKSLREMDGVRFVGQADVTTLSGRQAQLQILMDNNDTNSPRLTVDVIPIGETNSHDIKLELTIATDALVDLPPEDRPPDGSSRVRNVQSMQVDNSMSIRDGHTVVMGRSVEKSEKWLAAEPNIGLTEQRDLLILLTPTLIDPVGNRIFQEETFPQTAQFGD